MDLLFFLFLFSGKTDYELLEIEYISTRHHDQNFSKVGQTKR